MNNVPIAAVNLAMTFITSGVAAGNIPKFEAHQAHNHFQLLLESEFVDSYAAGEIFRIASNHGYPHGMIPGG